MRQLQGSPGLPPGVLHQLASSRIVPPGSTQRLEASPVVSPGSLCVAPASRLVAKTSRLVETRSPVVAEGSRVVAESPANEDSAVLCCIVSASGGFARSPGGAKRPADRRWTAPVVAETPAGVPARPAAVPSPLVGVAERSPARARRPAAPPDTPERVSSPSVSRRLRCVDSLCLVFQAIATQGCVASGRPSGLESFAPTAKCGYHLRTEERLTR